jgi:acyl-[acyl-carrier-protein]-phospholipid O-acyltransferase / long-chain-fatty-acid--[acyl-carrier-protein] ligase
MKMITQNIVLIILRNIALLLSRIFFQLHTQGKDKIPTTGGALIVANHVSYLDFLMVLASVPRHVSFVMNADVFKKPILRFFFESARCIPIAPRGGKNDLEAFNQAVSQRINNGELVVIFAEGTVTRTGQMLEFKKGVEHISRLIQAPILPIHFYNVAGSPFSFKAGRSQMQKITWRGFRSPIRATIGSPLQAPITAHELRQKIKELEVENFQRYLNECPDLPELLYEAINKNNRSAWHASGVSIAYRTLPAKMSSLDRSLAPVMNGCHCVAIMIPKSVDAMALLTWLLIRRLPFVIFPDNLSNEEQLFVLNKSGADRLITTKDLNFTRVAPIGNQVIFMEDLLEAEKKGQPVPVIYRHATRLQQSILSWFRTSQPRNELACIFFEKIARNNLTCSALSYQNLQAVIQGLRHVYFFKKTDVQLSDLPLSQANGLVMELLIPLLHDMDLHIVTDDHEAEFIGQLTAVDPTIAIATPTQIRQLAALAERQNLAHLTHLFTANINPNDPAVQQLRKRNIDVFVCAGLNQTSSVFAINLEDYAGIDIVGKTMTQENQNMLSIGKALPGVTIKITDKNGIELATNQKGRLWIKGSSVANMHHTNSSCAMALDQQWLPTNIEASIDHQGFILTSFEDLPSLENAQFSESTILQNHN